MGKGLYLYKIDPEYLRFLHSIESKISVKYNNRPFVGIITMVNGIKYVLPLTSQTTQKRREAGKNKRSPQITTFVKDSSNVEIANILHNNMFPIKEGLYEKIEINPLINTYELNEIRYIRKHRDDIIRKAKLVYEKRKGDASEFLKKTCCDFEKIESHYMEYKE